MISNRCLKNSDLLDYPNQCYLDGKAYSFGTTNLKGECSEVVCDHDYSGGIHT